MPETSCCVPFCSQKGKHLFPKDEKRRNVRVHAIRRGKSKYNDVWKPSAYSYLCGNHFSEDDYHVQYTYGGKEREKQALKKTAVPSIFSWSCEETLKKNKARPDRYLSRLGQKKKKLFEDISNSEDAFTEPEFIAQKLDIIPVDEDIDLGAVEEIVQYDDRNPSVELQEEPSATQMCNVEIQTLKLPPFSIHNFEHDPFPVHFYTGLEDY